MLQNQLCFFGNKDQNTAHAQYTITLTDKHRELIAYHYPGSGQSCLELTDEQYQAWLVEQQSVLKAKGGSLVVLSLDQDVLEFTAFSQGSSRYQAVEQYLVLESVYAPTWHPVSHATLPAHSYIFFPIDHQAQLDLKTFIEQLSRFPEDRAQLMLYCLRFNTIQEKLQHLEHKLQATPKPTQKPTPLNLITLGLLGLVFMMTIALILKPDPLVVDYNQQLTELNNELKKNNVALGQLDAKINNRFTNVRDRFDKMDRDLDIIFTSDIFKNQSDIKPQPTASETPKTPETSQPENDANN